LSVIVFYIVAESHVLLRDKVYTKQIF